MRTTDAVLITGPAASGKSTLGARLVRLLDDRELFSEDAYWVRHGWGAGLRSVEQEDVVQAAVLEDVLAAHGAGRGAVIEFILYKPPPNPLSAYREALDAAGLGHRTIALAPSVEVILDRMRRRGRPDDLTDLDGRRLGARRQLDCVRAPTTAADLIVEDDATIDEIADRWLSRPPSDGSR